MNRVAARAKEEARILPTGVPDKLPYALCSDATADQAPHLVYFKGLEEVFKGQVATARANIYAPSTASSVEYTWYTFEDSQIRAKPMKNPVSLDIKSAIVKLIETSPKLDDEEIGEAFGMPAVAASILLREMEADGLIRRV